MITGLATHRGLLMNKVSKKNKMKRKNNQKQYKHFMIQFQIDFY